MRRCPGASGETDHSDRPLAARYLGRTRGHVTQITAPLVSGAPRALDISIPCSAIATLPAAGGLVVSTLPSGGVDTGKNGLFVRADKDVVVVAFRDTVAAVAQRSAVAAGACSRLHTWANGSSVGAEFVGIPGAAGRLPAEKKPQVGGIFTDLKVPAQPGLVGPRRHRHPVHYGAHRDQEDRDGPGVLAVLVAILGLAALDRHSRGAATGSDWRSPEGAGATSALRLGSRTSA